jgi:sec-independent protein translocase protein TatB
VFDVGFSELMVIAVVALIVIGPERLPRVARTLGHLFGRLQRYVNDVKADINREIELEELRKFRSTFEDAARGIESTVNTTVDSVQGEVAKTGSELNSLAQDPEAAPSAVPAPDSASQLHGKTAETPSEAPSQKSAV